MTVTGVLPAGSLGTRGHVLASSCLARCEGA